MQVQLCVMVKAANRFLVCIYTMLQCDYYFQIIEK